MICANVPLSEPKIDSPTIVAVSKFNPDGKSIVSNVIEFVYNA